MVPFFISMTAYDSRTSQIIGVSDSLFRTDEIDVPAMKEKFHASMVEDKEVPAECVIIVVNCLSRMA